MHHSLMAESNFKWTGFGRMWLRNANSQFSPGKLAGTETWHVTFVLNVPCGLALTAELHLIS